MAEKIRTLVNRGESSDLYDVWTLLNKGVLLDKKLLETKLKEKNSKIKNMKIPSKKAYHVELKELLHYLPPYEQVKDYVIEKLSS